jgi:hypothetical protein
MSWVEQIQKKPQKEKIRIMWTVSITVVVLLLAVWVISTRFEKNVDKDTSLFQTLGKGFKDVKDNFKK